MTATRCDHTWPGHRMRTHDRGQVITLIGAHRCILAPDHPPGCLCACGATTTTLTVSDGGDYRLEVPDDDR